MPPDTVANTSVAISDVTSARGPSGIARLLASQPFWITLVIVAICAVLSALQPDSFPTSENFYNITRNFSFIGIMALGMTAVIITGGIDLSVGSTMGWVGIVVGVILEAGQPWWLAMAAGLATGIGIGLINGMLIAYVGLPSFVVTLGMLSIGRSQAVVISQNRMISDFGPDADTVYAIGGGETFGVANPVWLLIVLAGLLAFVLTMTPWGRYLFAIGGNENAARLTGVPVARIKLQAYVVSSLAAAVATLMILGWQGSAINALGQGYELRVIASTVIGGADLMGGAGSAFGAFIGSALIEVIRNALLMAGVDSNWQGTFIGVILILAVLLQRVRGRKRD